MKLRLVSMILLGFLGVILLGLVYYAWRLSEQARVVVEWSTASELDTVGFNLYRSENSADPGILINSTMIPASLDSQTGGDYKYSDKDVVPGRVYYYYLEDVSTDGTKNRNGPVVVKAYTSGSAIWGVIIALAAVTFFGFVSLIWIQWKKRYQSDE